MDSPLIHGFESDAHLDLLIKFLPSWFVNALNTVLYDTYPFWINVWSLTHLLWGGLWAAAYAWTGSDVFSLAGWLLFHTAFELWELWAGNYQPFGSKALDLREVVDGVMDTVLAVVGYLFVRLFMK